MLNLNFNPFPTLFTERLLLRRITVNDANDFLNFRANKFVAAALDKDPLPDIKSAINYIVSLEINISLGKQIAWAITLKNTTKLIGDIAFYKIDDKNYRAEMGYALLPEFQQMGICSEAMNVVLPYGFSQMNLHSIEAQINPVNFKSENLLLKNGFIKEGHIKQNYFFNNNFTDTGIYSLLKSNYIKQ